MSAARRRLALIALHATALACADPGSCPAADLEPAPRRPAFVTVSSDYGSSAIALLDARGEALVEAWLDSGTVRPEVVAALSGDVTLPTRTLAPCLLAVIDRFGTDVLTFLDPCTDDPGSVLLGQLDVGASFRANPHDAVAAGDGRALVSRHTANADPAAPPLARGNDLLLVDWRAARILSRIDLSSLDTTVEVEGDAGGSERVAVIARPSRLVRLEASGFDRVVVGLARLSRDWTVSGPGAVAAVDPAAIDPAAIDAQGGLLGALELDGLLDCEEVDPVPGEPALAFVTCRGEPFVDEARRRRGAGVVLIELGEDGRLRERARWAASEHPEQPVFNTGTVPLSAERVVITAMGDLSAGVADRVAVLAPGPGTVQPLMEAGSAFVIGEGAYDPEAQLLLLPDAHEAAVRRYTIGGDGAARELSAVDTAGCRGLPPRHVGGL